MHDLPAGNFPRRAAAFVSPAAGVFLVLWLTLLVAGRAKLFQDPGTFWHTVLGQRLLATGEFTKTDFFTFTFAGERWLTLQWLGEAVMAAAYAIGGWDTQLLLAATLLAATYAWVASRLMCAGLHWLPAAVVVALLLAASSHHFHVRPHLATITLMGVTMAMLCDVESGRASPHRLWWLVPLFALWTNLHGGVLGGLVTVAVAVVGWIGRWLLAANVERRTTTDNAEARPTRHSTFDVRRSMFDVPSAFDVRSVVPPVRNLGQCFLLGAILLSLAVSLLLNPYGLEMPRAWLRIMSMPLGDLIQEHRPLDLSRPEGAIIAVLALGYLWLLKDAVVVSRRPRITWLLPLVWLLLAWTRVRHAPLFAIVSAIALADLLPHTRLARWCAKWQHLAVPLTFAGATDESRQVHHRSTTGTGPLRTMLIGSVVVTAALLVQFFGVTLPIVGRGWAGHDTRRWPVEVLPQLRQLEREQPGTLVFNSLDFGGFVTFHTPGLKTFIDDRCELFGDAFLSSYGEAERQKPQRIDAWAEQYGFRLALVRSGSPFDAYLQSTPRWRALQRTQAATLWAKSP